MCVCSVSVAKLYGVKYGYPVSASSEMKALGLVNILGSFLQCQVQMGAFSRSAVNDRVGAKSQVSTIFIPVPGEHCQLLSDGRRCRLASP